MLTAVDARNIAKPILYTYIEPYISAINDKIAKSALGGQNQIGYEFSGDEIEFISEIIRYLTWLGYTVKTSNSIYYITIIW